MAEGQRMTAADVAAQVRDGRLEDFVREAVVLVAREVMEAEISEQVGAELGEVALPTPPEVGLPTATLRAYAEQTLPLTLYASANTARSWITPAAVTRGGDGWSKDQP